MNTTVELKEIFAKDIDRRINGVIKAHDDRDLSQEIDEYVLTNEIQENLEKFFDAYDDPRQPCGQRRMDLGVLRLR